MQAINKNTDLLIRYLKHIRQTQIEISKKTGVTQSTVSNLFSGKKKFNVDIAQRFENAYGISSEWLLYGTGNMMVNGETPDIPYEVRTLSIDEIEERQRLLDIIAEQQKTITRLSKLLQNGHECSTKK